MSKKFILTIDVRVTDFDEYKTQGHAHLELIAPEELIDPTIEMLEFSITDLTQLAYVRKLRQEGYEIETETEKAEAEADANLPKED